MDIKDEFERIDNAQKNNITCYISCLPVVVRQLCSLKSFVATYLKVIKSSRFDTELSCVNKRQRC
jgi:hypothetical protein